MNRKKMKFLEGRAGNNIQSTTHRVHAYSYRTYIYKRMVYIVRSQSVIHPWECTKSTHTYSLTITHLFIIYVCMLSIY